MNNTPLSQQELDTLDLLAGAATPGPWAANTENPKKWVTKAGVSDEEWAANRHNDALFVAAANPDTISRLVRQVMALQDEVRQQLAQAEQQRRLDQTTSPQ